MTVVLLGTNHGASWLDGVAGWGPGAWRTPLGDVPIDAELADAVLGLGAPFLVDREAHRSEHSIEVQLPILQAVAPRARIVPLAVSTGTGDDAVAAGARLGALLAQRRAAGYPVVLAISSDMAHYPFATACARATDAQLPAILSLEPAALAVTEAVLVAGGTPGLVCGMCGIEPAVLGVSALRAMGARTRRRARDGHVGRRRRSARSDGRLPRGGLDRLSFLAGRAQQRISRPRG